MNIPDGEYDIDLLVLGESPEAEFGASSLALRYGFIPDSMDQANPLTLFQQDEVCILEADLVERINQTGLPPIIFEGVPQKQRPLQASLSLSLDSYFLSFLPAEKGLDGRLHVQLRRLESTVRVNKSRNPEKWRSSIKKWRSDPAKPQPKAPESLQPARIRSPHVLSPLLKRKPGRPPVKNGTTSKSAGQNQNQNQIKSENARSNPVVQTVSLKRTTPASKRPPVSVSSEQKQDIISVSDFEDLESDDDGDGFPVFETTSVVPEENKKTPLVKEKPVSKKVEPQSTSNKMDNNENAKSNDINTKESRTLNTQDAEDLDMDDEFADLEDQLDEVLDERQAKPNPVDSDSDEDSDTGAFVSTPIVIDTGEEKKSTTGLKLQGTSSQSKPMSLRDLYGGERNDYLSSSEEE